MKKTSYETICGTSKVWETIYFEIEPLSGGFLATTEGDPITLNELEDAGAEEEIMRIENAIANCHISGAENPTKADFEYVNGWLLTYGCEPIKAE